LSRPGDHCDQHHRADRNADGLRVRYVETGTGPVVLVLNGKPT
jgi:hypothetical protein